MVVLPARHDKGSLVPLSLQWEPAVEVDLSRAIAALDAPVLPAMTSTVDAAAVQELIQAHPELASATVEEGTQILRASALVEFASAMKDMQAQLTLARQRFKTRKPPAPRPNSPRRGRKFSKSRRTRTRNLPLWAPACKNNSRLSTI